MGSLTVVIGAGLAGLAATLRLVQAGREVLLLEATDRVGGRLRTFRTDGGCLLDRGFQVVLDSYPSIRRLFSLETLAPRYFASGAIIAAPDGFHRLENPLTRPASFLASAFSPVFPFADRLRLGSLALHCLLHPDRYLLGSCHRPDEESTAALLSRLGFGARSLNQFFRPFFGGVLLDSKLETSSGLFRYYFRKFLTGGAFLPAGGIAELPAQLAAKLPSGVIRLKSPALGLQRVGNRVVSVRLQDGSEVATDSLILATDGEATAKLLTGFPLRPSHGVWTFYFLTRSQLYDGPFLVLNGQGGPIAHLMQLSNLGPGFCPPSHHLTSATVLEPGFEGGQSLAAAVRENLIRLFPAAADAELVGEVHIPDAVPCQPPGFASSLPRQSGMDNVWLAGDQVDGASIETAITSGEAAADRVMQSTNPAP